MKPENQILTQMKNFTIPPLLHRSIVYLLFIVFFGISLNFIYRYGVNIPFNDEWADTVPHMTGALPVTWEWLWSPWNEHRIALPRLIEWAVLRLSGFSFRTVMVVNISLIALGAALLIRLAARLRQQYAYDGVGFSIRFTDAFFPIALLHSGHWENLTAAFQIQFAASVFLSIAALYLTMAPCKEGTECSLFRVCILILVVLLLPLTGANGLLFAPPFILYLVCLWLRQRNNGLAAKVALCGGLLAIAEIILYFIGRHSPRLGESNSPAVMVQIILNFLLTSFGSGAAPRRDLSILPLIFGVMAIALSAVVATRYERGRYSPNLFLGWFGGGGIAVMFFLIFPWSRIYSLAFLFLVPVLILISVIGGGQTIRTFSKNEASPIQNLVILGGYLCSVVLSAVGVAVGRPVVGPVGFSSRYGWIAVQSLIAIYLGALVSRPRWVRAFLPLSLFLLALIFLPGNWQEGELWGGNKYLALNSFRKNAMENLPLSILSAVGVPVVSQEREELEQQIPHLRAAHIPPFETIPEVPSFKETSLLLEEKPLTISGSSNEAISIQVNKSSPLAAVVIRYTFPDVATIGTNYRITAIPVSRNDSPIFVTLPYRGIGGVLLRPQYAMKRLEIQAIPNLLGNSPGDITIDSIITFEKNKFSSK